MYAENADAGLTDGMFSGMNGMDIYP